MADSRTPCAPPSRGPQVLQYLELPEPLVDWGVSRSREEYPADLESLWRECPRADWLLRLSAKAGISEYRIRILALDLQRAEDSDEGLESILRSLTNNLDMLVEQNHGLLALQEAPVPTGSGGGSSGLSDEVFKRFAYIDRRIQTLHRQYCKRVRDAIDFTEVYKAIYTQESAGPKLTPYR